MRLVSVAFALVALSVSGCRAREAGSESDLYNWCESDSGCRRSGICLVSETGGRSCSIPCSDDAQCDRWRCGVGSGGRRICLPGCSGDGVVCVDGVPHSCATVTDETLCGQCGCNRDPMRPRCEPGVGCMARSDIGGPCLEDDDCRTGNCSRYEGICRVPLGAPCTGVEDCDRCIRHEETGWSFCSRACRSDGTDPCVQDGGGACLGQADTENFTCRPGCAACPGSCRFATDGTRWCDCQDCVVLEARPPGFRCYADEQCGSGDCWLRNWSGACTRACSSDAECGPLARCVDLPCAEGQSSRCGGTCLASCELTGSWNCEGRAACVALTTLTGETATVCDMRALSGDPCSIDAECASLRCVGGRCDSGGGAENGIPCDAAPDCASRNCEAGVCRGTRLLGDACTIPDDCVVGSCCVSGESAGTCQTTC
jgi:hypothetical protein